MGLAYGSRQRNLLAIAVSMETACRACELTQRDSRRGKDDSRMKSGYREKGGGTGWWREGDGNCLQIDRIEYSLTITESVYQPPVAEEEEAEAAEAALGAAAAEAEAEAAAAVAGARDGGGGGRLSRSSRKPSRKGMPATLHHSKRHIHTFTH